MVSWSFNIDEKFVFFTNKSGLIVRVQMLNRTGWGYADLKGPKEVGKIKVEEFKKIYKKYREIR